jgi:hypothetical protein
MKKCADLDPSDREFTTEVNRLLLPLFLTSSKPSLEAKGSSPQAGGVRLSLLLFRPRLLTNDADLQAPDDPYRFEKTLQQRAKNLLQAQDWERLLYLYKITFPSPIPENSRADGESQEDYFKRITRTAPYSRFSADLKRQFLCHIGLWDVYVSDSD